MTEPKAEEEDKRTKDLPCLGPVIAKGRIRGQKDQGPTLPAMGPVTEPKAEVEDKRTYLAWGQ